MTNTRKALYILSWMPVLLLHTLPLFLIWPWVDLGWWVISPVGLVPLGVIFVPIALLFDKWPRLLWLWGNDEEGCPVWWRVMPSTNQVILKFPCFWWYAFRNPVNNLRFIFKDRKAQTISNWGPMPMEAQDLIDRNVVSAYRWNFNGWFAGYRSVWLTKPGKYSEFWIGWKVGSTVPGMGFTLQYRRNRKIGT